MFTKVAELIRKTSIAAAAIVGFFAACPSDAEAQTWQWSGYRQVEYVYPETGGLSFKLLGSALPGSQTCANEFHMPDTVASFQLKAATLLTAYARRDVVDIVYDVAATSCRAAVDRFVSKAN